MDITYTNDAGYKISENVGIEGYCQGRLDCNLNIEKMINALKVFPGIMSHWHIPILRIMLLYVSLMKREIIN